MTQLEVPQGQFNLHRYPPRKNDPLRAWDAADEYLLHQLAEEGLPTPGSRVLIINDNFGALSTALHPWSPASAGDSFLAHRATETNLAGNHAGNAGVSLLTSLDPLPEHPDLVLIRIPKSLALLEEQLLRLRACVTPATRVFGAAMAKQIHTSTLQLFERILGPTRTSLARKKARLIVASPDPQLQPAASPYPIRYRLEGTGYQILNHAGVFSREKLDIGTRFFLEHLPASSDPRTIIDLGCGNGVVGLLAAERNPAACLQFVDESFMAVASAEANFRAAFGETREASFQAGDCLGGFESGSADLVLNNPPFHQQNVVGDHIARQMFRDARRVLRSGGELWVIGNRHLGYHVQLKRLFGNCRTVASNPKFVILRAVKR